ncbi:uncharacterized protein LOC127121630 [Lathyrus oleraceus]|uniref:uncharacterized protein LOC127121630 n=1 Tax=Pisum sativum TaxID=3888 RepID=UPI0021CE724B|nr:uncharacterized protein LOC127121630 [Pisum sativum]
MEQPMIEENITPPVSPIPRLDETSSSERTPRLRSIEEIYEVIENINDINLFFLLGNNLNMSEEFKKDMSNEFEMIDMGLMAYYLDIKVKQEDKGIFIIQEGYAKKSLRSSRWMMSIQLAPGGMWQQVESRKSRHGSSNNNSLQGGKKNPLIHQSDSDWSGDLDDRKSTIDFVFFMGDTALTWMSKKQPIITLSTCEAEYVAATSCVCHAV